MSERKPCLTCGGSGPHAAGPGLHPYRPESARRARERERREALSAGAQRFRAELAAIPETGAVEDFTAFQARAFAALRLLAVPEDWKMPIDATLAIDPEALGFALESVIFFTGSIPDHEYVGRGKFRVCAAGYYCAVGS